MGMGHGHYSPITPIKSGVLSDCAPSRAENRHLLGNNGEGLRAINPAQNPSKFNAEDTYWVYFLFVLISEKESASRAGRPIMSARPCGVRHG